MKLADAHIHLFSRGYPGRYGALFPRGGEVAVYNRIRAAHGIDCALAVGYEGAAWARGNNHYLSTLRVSHPWMVPLAYCAANRPPGEGQFATWWRRGFLGISVYLETREDAAAFARWPAWAASHLDARKAILSVNCPAALLPLARPAFDHLKKSAILISHFGSPESFAPAEKNLRSVCELASHPGIGVKLSGAYACGDYPHAGLEKAVDVLGRAFGAGRLYWGSDFSPALDHVSFSQTVSAFEKPGLSVKILHQNLHRIVRRARTFLPPP